MKSFASLIKTRRSCRKFDTKDIPPDYISQILEAALCSPTARNSRKWKFYLIDDTALLEKLSDSKERGSQFIKDSRVSVVISCDEKEDTFWIEDCSIAAITMQYQAEDLGLVSCWCQIRGFFLSDGTSSEQIVRGIANIPDTERVHSIISFGYPHPDAEKSPDRELLWERVTIVENEN